MTKKLRPFPTASGETVLVLPVSAVATTLRIKKKYPRPQPPLVRVEIGGRETYERNHSDPDYANSVRLWETHIEIEVMEHIIRRVAAKQSLSDEQREEVNALRSAFPDEEFSESDEYVWLTEIAISNDNELRELVRTATGMADPTEEGVSQAAANFRH